TKHLRPEGSGEGGSARGEAGARRGAGGRQESLQWRTTAGVAHRLINRPFEPDVPLCNGCVVNTGNIRHADPTAGAPGVFIVVVTAPSRRWRVFKSYHALAPCGHRENFRVTIRGAHELDRVREPERRHADRQRDRGNARKAPRRAEP